jgi:aquaporin Z
MLDALRNHWPEYLIEAAGLGLFMVSACMFATLLEHPQSPVHRALTDATLRRGLMGTAMGLTAIGIIYSPWGQRSGAHLNPAVTLTFWGLGKVHGPDAVFYPIFQFIGGALGVALSAAILGAWLGHPRVNYVVTVPGESGLWVALVAEAVMSAGLMAIVLTSSNHPWWKNWTGALAGTALFFYILLEAPLSGMSINPARTVASDVVAGRWTALWIYFVGPMSGMALAGFAFHLARSGRRPHCAKLQHDARTGRECVFRCGEDA